jgi:hypothetical protein
VRARTALAAGLLAALAGCASCDTVPPSAVTDCNLQIVRGAAAADILFVVDDSGSMTDKQQALADNLSSFIDGLTSSAVALDLRIGVTNTSLDDYNGRTGYGAAAVVAGVTYPYPGPPGAPFPRGTIIAIDPDTSGTGQFGHFTWGKKWDPAGLVSTWGGPRILSSGPDLARDFKANIHQGEWGSGKEQPLRAMRAALDASSVTNSPNFGFLRSGARLAVVILTDEDDCSESATLKNITSDNVCHATGGYTTQIDSPYFDPINGATGFVSYLDDTIGGISGQPPIVAAIAGFDPNGVATGGCTGGGFSSSADPRRIGAFLDRLEVAHPERTKKLSICQPFGAALTSIAKMIFPQTMPLLQSPADYRMMIVSVHRAVGTTVGCRMEEAGTTAAASADVVYTPAPTGGNPSLTFQNGCLLSRGDAVDIGIVCVQ